MYHKIEMHISKFNNYLIFSEHFLEPNFFKGIHLAKPKKNELKSIFNYLQNIRYDMTNKDHFTNLPEKMKEILIKVLLIVFYLNLYQNIMNIKKCFIIH